MIFSTAQAQAEARVEKEETVHVKVWVKVPLLLVRALLISLFLLADKNL